MHNVYFCIYCVAIRNNLYWSKEIQRYSFFLKSWSPILVCPNCAMTGPCCVPGRLWQSGLSIHYALDGGMETPVATAKCWRRILQTWKIYINQLTQKKSSRSLQRKRSGVKAYINWLFYSLAFSIPLWNASSQVLSKILFYGEKHHYLSLFSLLNKNLLRMF